MASSQSRRIISGPTHGRRRGQRRTIFHQHFPNMLPCSATAARRPGIASRKIQGLQQVGQLRESLFADAAFAQSGHPTLRRRHCPPSGVKRTWPIALHMSAMTRSGHRLLTAPSQYLEKNATIPCPSLGGDNEAARFIKLIGDSVAGTAARRKCAGAGTCTADRRVLARNGSNKEARHRYEVFRDALKQLGWVESRNVHFDVRSVGGKREVTQAATEEIVALPPRSNVGERCNRVVNIVATYTDDTNRVCAGRRSSRRRLCREPCRTRGRCDGFCQFRICDCWQTGDAI